MTCQLRPPCQGLLGSARGILARSSPRVLSRLSGVRQCLPERFRPRRWPAPSLQRWRLQHPAHLQQVPAARDTRCRAPRHILVCLLVQLFEHSFVNVSSCAYLQHQYHQFTVINTAYCPITPLPQPPDRSVSSPERQIQTSKGGGSNEPRFRAKRSPPIFTS